MLLHGPTNERTTSGKNYALYWFNNQCSIKWIKLLTNNAFNWVHRELVQLFNILITFVSYNHNGDVKVKRHHTLD